MIDGKWLGMLALVAVGCDPQTIEDATVETEAEIIEEAEFRGGSPAFCDNIYTFEHEVSVGDGAVLRVIEKFSPASVLQFPRRSVLMLPGTLVTGELYNIDIDGGSDFNALDRAAAQGFFAFSVTYEGYPGSSIPDDGSTVDEVRTLEQMGVLIEKIRHARHVKKVDLLGTSFGSSLAIALGGSESPIPPSHIGRIIMQALVYKGVTPLFEEVFFSPEVQELLLNAPDGYIQTAPEQYGLILANTDPAAAAYGFENFPDVYATGPTLTGFDLPLFDGANGIAPALQFWGDADLITPLSDVETFQSEYAGPNELRIVPGVGHSPFIAEPDELEFFWSESFDFLDYGYGFFLACEPDD